MRIETSRTKDLKFVNQKDRWAGEGIARRMERRTGEAGSYGLGIGVSTKRRQE
jgi:hypothetical protein